MIASAIEEADQGTRRKEEQLVNVCLPYFDFSGKDEDRTMRIAMDGKM